MPLSPGDIAPALSCWHETDGTSASLLGLVAVAGLVASFHTIIFAYGRNIFSLSRAGYYPNALSVTDANRKTPHVALVLGDVLRRGPGLPVGHEVHTTRVGEGAADEFARDARHRIFAGAVHIEHHRVVRERFEHVRELAEHLLRARVGVRLVQRDEAPAADHRTCR